MASPVLITESNWPATLKLSSNPRGSAPDGNIYIAPSYAFIQLITVEENPTIDFGSGPEANPLTNATQIQGIAVYKFLKSIVSLNSSLRALRPAIDAVGNRMGYQVGALSNLNGFKYASGAVDANSEGGSLGDDRLKLAATGITEFAATGNGATDKDRVYHCAQGSGIIAATAQCYFMLSDSVSESDRQAATPTDFVRLGKFDQVIQTEGSTAFGDSGAGDFDSKSKVLIICSRPFGYSHDEIDSNSAGAAELGAYRQSYSLVNNPVAELAGITESDVFGGSAIAPYDGISFRRAATPETVTGFNESDGDFSDIIENTGGASLIQVRAWLDIFSNQDTNQNTNSSNTGNFYPKRAEPFYSINTDAKLVTREDVLIKNIPTVDLPKIIQTASGGDAKTYPVNTAVTLQASTVWGTDTARFYSIFYKDGAGALDFGETGAVLVRDASGTDLEDEYGLVFAVSGGYEIRFAYDTADASRAGISTAGDIEMSINIGGAQDTGGSTAQAFSFTIPAGATTFSFDARTAAETN